MTSIANVMKTNVVTVEKGTPILDAIKKLVDHSFSGLPVVDDENCVVGILSEKDVLALAIRVNEYGGDSGECALRVEDFMTKEVVSVELGESLTALCSCLMKNEFRRVPILAHGKLAGIVSRQDIIIHILKINSRCMV